MTDERSGTPRDLAKHSLGDVLRLGGVAVGFAKTRPSVPG
jgi:hypothetical protein